jgi:2-hydroxy-6-oxonona-2,4-dienedioate hydrolase
MTSTTDLTETGTSRTLQAGGMTIHYHEAGQGYPVVFLHSYGPGTTAWITFHKIIGVLSQHFRCILMDLPNFGRTGPVVFNEPVHDLQARTALHLMDALGIDQAHLVGNSQGGQSAMVFAYTYPHRIDRLVTGACHIATGGDRYLMANKPSEGSRASREVYDHPTRDNVRRYLRVHLDDASLVTDDLVEYIYQNHTGHADHEEARQQSVSVYHDHGPDIATIQAPTLIIWGRYDRMCAFEIGIAALNHIDNSRLLLLNKCGHWPPYEHPQEYATQVRGFLLS